MKTSLLIALLVFVLLGIGAAIAQESPIGTPLPAHHLNSEQLKHLTEAARSARDYRELASYLRQEAQRMRATERYHMEMAALYRVHPLPFDGKQTVHMQDHCMYFADKARDAAIAADEMAIVQDHIADQIESGQTRDAALLSTSSATAVVPHTLIGVISDEMCRQNHMMPGHSEADCTRACVKAGVHYALVTDDKVYVLKADPKQIEQFAGKTVTITGEVKKGTVLVQAISRPN